MNKIVSVLICLIIIIGFAFVLNAQPASATPVLGSISIVKDGARDTTNSNVINYTFTVKNTGTIALSNVNITDTLIPTANINWPASFTGWDKATMTLQPGITVVATASLTISSSDTEVVNNATVTGQYPNGLGGHYTVSDSSQKVVPPLPELPAGMLFGMGLLGIGGFVIFKKYRRVTASK